MKTLFKILLVLASPFILLTLVAGVAILPVLAVCIPLLLVCLPFVFIFSPVGWLIMFAAWIYNKEKRSKE